MKEHILGYEVASRPHAECADAMVRWVVEGDGCKTFACINPHTYAGALKGERIRAALRSADWLVPDGVGIVLASKVLGGRIRERVTGYDVFTGVLDGLNRRGTFRIFFFGSTAATLAAIQERMKRDYPNLVVAGVLPDPAPGLRSLSPPFPPMYSDEQREAILSTINDARTDVLWVGMTAPKQELWIHENRARLNVRFAGAVGAVFDFYIGRVKRSAPFFLEHGLEWLPRLVQEPRRLWRRMLVSAPIFLRDLMVARLMGRTVPVTKGDIE